ncbi:TonB-dependent receptor [uncultured Winogradskyella sp.]|uniref:outer membrane beta-barrel family protein n=1 Tax=uncultured Winogradskyella sp. TaxID=395353 RepID=UPI0030D7FFD4
MVDGKLSNIPTEQLLKQIPSTSIKSIELITNPSAKYNPEGMSGIINIILYKNVNIGFNGNINLGLSYQLEPKFNSSIDMNYRNGKLNFYGSYGNNISDNRNTGLLNQTETDISQTFNFLDDRNSHLFKAGIDIYINDKKENASQQYNVNYKLEFDKEGHNIELEVDHNIFDNDLETLNSFTGFSARPNFDEYTIVARNRTTVNLDYTNPLSETAKLELGLQVRLFDNKIDYNSDARVINQLENYIPTSTVFDYERNIYSAYATYGKKLDKWSYKIGLRAETVIVDALAIDMDLTDNTTTNLPFKNDYFQVYPSAFVTYSPSEKNSYQFSYSRRVDRPGVGQVNPIPEFNTPLISQFGNPELQPQFTNSVEVNYTRNLEKGSITTGVFYRLIEDEINQGVFVDRSDFGSGRVILTNDNFDTTSAYGVELSSSYRPTKWWSLNTSFDLYARKQTGFAESLDPTIPNPIESDIEINKVEVDNLIYNFRIFNNFKVTKDLSLSAFAMYRGKDTGLNFEMDPMYFVNLGMRYSFLEDNRATFSLNFNNVFDTQEIYIVSERPFKQNVQFKPEFSTIFAGLSYRFGGGKYKAKSRKRRDNDEKSCSGFM